MVNKDKITPLRDDYKKRNKNNKVVINTAFEEKVSIKLMCIFQNGFIP